MRLAVTTMRRIPPNTAIRSSCSGRFRKMRTLNTASSTGSQKAPAPKSPTSAPAVWPPISPKRLSAPFEVPELNIDGSEGW